MKSVLISIQPQWCELIASGKKTIEVRKNRPKIETPFKCYIYCSKGKTFLYKNPNNGELFLDSNGGYRGGDYEDRFLTGKVIGEFICDKIDRYPYGDMAFPTPAYDGDPTCCECGDGYFITCGELEKTCLEYEDLENYGKIKTLYGWHITDLKIYDKPKEFGEFVKPCDWKYDCCTCKRAVYELTKAEAKLFYGCDREITRPPQSWQYVEKLQ